MCVIYKSIKIYNEIALRYELTQCDSFKKKALFLSSAGLCQRPMILWHLFLP